MLRSKIEKMSKKYSLSMIAFGAFFMAPLVVLNMAEVQKMTDHYKMILVVSVLACILITVVSYLTGQAKIDLSARTGKFNDSNPSIEPQRDP